MVVDTEVDITGEGQGAPDASTNLAKILTKDEPILQYKGKTKLMLPGFENMTAEELHHEFLTRLFQMRDTKTNLDNMLRKKYDDRGGGPDLPMR